MKVDRENRFQEQMSCILGREQEERTVEASTASAEDKWVRRLLQEKKNLEAGKLVQDLGPRGYLNFCFQLCLCSPAHPSPVLSTSW